MIPAMLDAKTRHKSSKAPDVLLRIGNIMDECIEKEGRAEMDRMEALLNPTVTEFSGDEEEEVKASGVASVVPQDGNGSLDTSPKSMERIRSM